MIYFTKEEMVEINKKINITDTTVCSVCGEAGTQSVAPFLDVRTQMLDNGKSVAIMLLVIHCTTCHNITFRHAAAIEDIILNKQVPMIVPATVVPPTIIGK